MGAAESLEFDAPDDIAGRRELAMACSSLMAAALGQYYSDCRSTLVGAKMPGDRGEALDDLTGSRELLANLCAAFEADMDADTLGDLMLDALEQGLRFRSSGMNRAVPETHDDLSGLGTWKKQHKRKGKPRAWSIRG